MKNYSELLLASKSITDALLLGTISSRSEIESAASTLVTKPTKNDLEVLKRLSNESIATLKCINFVSSYLIQKNPTSSAVFASNLTDVLRTFNEENHAPTAVLETKDFFDKLSSGLLNKSVKKTPAKKKEEPTKTTSRSSSYSSRPSYSSYIPSSCGSTSGLGRSSC